MLILQDEYCFEIADFRESVPDEFTEKATIRRKRQQQIFIFVAEKSANLNVINIYLSTFVQCYGYITIVIKYYKKFFNINKNYNEVIL